MAPNKNIVYVLAGLLAVVLAGGAAGVNHYHSLYKSTLSANEDLKGKSSVLNAEVAKMKLEKDELQKARESLSRILTERGIESAETQEKVRADIQAREALLGECQLNATIMAEKGKLYEESLNQIGELHKKIESLESELENMRKKEALRSAAPVPVQQQQAKEKPEPKIAPKSDQSQKLPKPYQPPRAPQRSIDTLPPKLPQQAQPQEQPQTDIPAQPQAQPVQQPQGQAPKSAAPDQSARPKEPQAPAVQAPAQPEIRQPADVKLQSPATRPQ